MWSTQIFIGVDMYLATATSVVDCLVFKKLLLLLLGLGTALPPSFWYGWSSLLLLGAGLSPSVWYGWFSLLLLCSALSPSVWYGWAVLLLLDTAILPSIWYGWSALLLLDTDLLPSVWYGLGSLLGGGDVVGGWLLCISVTSSGHASTSGVDLPLGWSSGSGPWQCMGGFNTWS